MDLGYRGLRAPTAMTLREPLPCRVRPRALQTLGWSEPQAQAVTETDRNSTASSPS